MTRKKKRSINSLQESKKEETTEEAAPTPLPQASPLETSLDQGLNLFEQGKITQAQKSLVKILATEEKNLKAEQKAKILHALGTIAFEKKNNQDSLSYLGRLYLEHPTAAEVPEGMITMAQTFERMNQRDNAIQTLKELIHRYPKSKKVSKAQKLLEQLY